MARPHTRGRRSTRCMAWMQCKCFSCSVEHSSVRPPPSIQITNSPAARVGLGIVGGFIFFYCRGTLSLTTLLGEQTHHRGVKNHLGMIHTVGRLAFRCASAVELGPTPARISGRAQIAQNSGRALRLLVYIYRIDQCSAQAGAPGFFQLCLHFVLLARLSEFATQGAK